MAKPVSRSHPVWKLLERKLDKLKDEIKKEEMPKERLLTAAKNKVGDMAFYQALDLFDVDLDLMRQAEALLKQVKTVKHPGLVSMPTMGSPYYLAVQLLDFREVENLKADWRMEQQGKLNLLQLRYDRLIMRLVSADASEVAKLIKDYKFWEEESE